ncbi:MAG: 30S ribosomal protein S21 [Bacilli bacterium]|nr:30S ribosomal protein S21 [Bacilli bacterium]
MSVKGGTNMPKTIVRENETIEDTLKRFKRDVSRSGTLQEARKREHYLKPSDIKKMKKRALKKSQYKRSN